MAVLVEAFSVVVRRTAIAERFDGGWPAFQRAIPNATDCFDDDLVRVGFMSPSDVEAFVSVLEAGGLVFYRNNEEGEETAIDIALVDQLRGPMVPAPWLDVGNIVLFKPKLRVCACWLAGQKPDEIVFPNGWKFEGSLSDKPGYVAEGDEGGQIKFLRHENGNDVYLDIETGKEVFKGLATVQGDTEAALFTQLRKMCHDVLSIEEEIKHYKALSDDESALQLFDQLQEGLLPETERIVNGPGQNMAFAHFTHGLVLRILNRLPEAELSFRKANELQAGVINTLREIILCLGKQGKHKEALPFAHEAINAGPPDAGAWGNLAMILVRCGDRDEAWKAIEFAIELDPANPINLNIRDNFESLFK